jgi:hypothetical protein
MKQYLFLLLFSACLAASSTAQDSIAKYQPRLILEFPLLDFPHMNKAAGMAYNKRLDKISGGTVSPNVGDYLRSYESLSMQQALAVTKNLHATNYYFNNKLWNKWIEPTTKKKQLLNRLAANISSGVVDYALAYYLMVFGPVWLHEEFHRNGVTHQCISSHNDTYYRFGGGSPGGSISKVRDEDLIRFKQTKPQEMVRSFAAGIEAQYELVRNMRKDNFFSRTNYANAVMNILITKQAVDYVNQFKQKNYDATIDTANKYEPTIAGRDFVGWDFTAWVYDMFRPNEPYTARGIHPNGNGIHRDIKRSDLTKEEDAFLGKMGRMQYINFLSPAMLSISRIKLNEKTYFSFAGRHILNSFGYDMGADLFFEHKGRQWFIGLHGYNNKEKFFPGIEIENPSLKVKLGKKEIPVQARAMAWLQPKDQLFTTTKAEAGGLLQVKGRYPISKTFAVYAELEGKTNGWVAGNPYLDKNLTIRTGLFIDIKK